MRADSLSLWLVPTGEVRERLATEISRLATRFGTPAFEPHVTLLSGLPPTDQERVARATGVWAHETAPIEVLVGGAGQSSAFFRCTFLGVEATAELTGARRSLCGALGCEAERPYFPHLSLVYGLLTEGERCALVREIGDARSSRFVATAVHLYVTRGTVEDWTRAATFELAGGIARPYR